MCGICGVVALDGPLDLPRQSPERMIGIMRHRGPDEFGAWRDRSVFLGHARLSIIDVAQGQQPMTTAQGRYWITFNGEIFNYPELRAELQGLGHAFRTNSDTEVILAAYIQWGPACVERFNGQFAFAVYDRNQRHLFLARDRFGIRPLFLTMHQGQLLFASEIKSLRAFPGLNLELEPAALAEIFRHWTPIGAGTAFRGVAQLPPGHVAMVGDDSFGAPAPAPLPACLRVRRYWHPTFLPADEDHRFVPADERDRLAREVRRALVDAATIRLRADVPVGAYLSGGLDSSATAAIIRRYTDHQLNTFSVGFEDAAYDEARWQHRMAAHLGTRHQSTTIGAEDIAGRLREVTWLAETPLLRTAPAPLHALSGLARHEHFKVVLTGEGADEVFVGYNIFREAKVRYFWSRDPASRCRSVLLTRLYPYLAQSPEPFLRKFYGTGLDSPDDPLFSHGPRWSNTASLPGFLGEAAQGAHPAGPARERLLASLPADFGGWGPVARAQYLEMTTFMANYLLSSQGDRMLMGHSVEGRFPFLDHHVAELAGRIPASIKLQSLVEKSILKLGVADLLPDHILERAKQPYRAPDSSSLQSPAGQALVRRFLDAEGTPGWGIWQPDRIAALVRKWRAGKLTSVRDNMSLIAVLTGRMLQHDFGPGFENRMASNILPEQALAWRQG
ncbi:asparagine synthase (glutamine-hydrolyzing) [bacterium DOLZORAL124_64_63]|nr:MAG: asparagine synthase (glutamine-hydrolyzing) [bacterium DOLZORAL124_64_63]